MSIDHQVQINDDKGIRVDVVRRLILFAREDIDSNLSTWPKDERRRIAIKDGDVYPELKNVQFIFDILIGITKRRISSVNKWKQCYWNCICNFITGIR